MKADPDFRVLVVDDDPDTRSNLCDILELDHYHIETAGTVAEVLGRNDWARISAILLDRRLPDSNAEELLPRLRQLAPDTAILIVTGYADPQGASPPFVRGRPIISSSPSTLTSSAPAWPASPNDAA